MDTLTQYQSVIESCRNIYIQKATDYGTSWRMLRSISIVDQIYIKAWRIRQIQELGRQKIADSIENEFIGIINYSLIALIQLTLPENRQQELTIQNATSLYDEQTAKVKELMVQKNHDYGEAWRHMSQESFVDLILTKLLRIKQIIANDGKTLVSEGIGANFCDIINYGVFALIKIRFSSSGADDTSVSTPNA